MGARRVQWQKGNAALGLRLASPRPEAEANAPSRVSGAEPLVHAASLHLFRDESSYYCYDVTTANLLQVNEFTYQLLEVCSSVPLDALERELAARFPGLVVDEAIATVRAMKQDGMFRFLPFQRKEQERALEVLLQHQPRRLQLLLAQMCNLKCLYCYEEANGSNARKKLMSAEMAQACVDYLTEKSGARRDLEITFFGGEPLLNFEVLRATVDYCRGVEKRRPDKRFSFETITNGVLLTKDKVDYFIEHEFNLMVSLDGDRQMNNFNRPSVSGADYYDKIVENARYAAQAYRRSPKKLPIKVRANLTHAHHDLTKTVRFLESLGFTSVGIAAIDDLPWSVGAQQSCTELDLDDIEHQHGEMLELAISKAIAGERLSAYETKLFKVAMAPPEPDRAVRGLRCGVGRNTNIVDIDGNIFPCHRYGNLEPYRLGNILTGGLDRDRMMAYYAVVNRANLDKCQNCWARNLCSGMCPWELSRPDGAVFEPHETRCVRLRRGFQQNMALRQRVARTAPALLDQQKACGPCACPTISSHVD